MRPPTSAWDEDDGMPSRHVRTFQKTAAKIPQMMTATALIGGRSERSTKLPIVFATAVPTINGPRNSKIATRTTAWTGVMALDAMTVAMMFDASWKPFVKSKITTMATATTDSTTTGSIALPSPR